MKALGTFVLQGLLLVVLCFEVYAFCDSRHANHVNSAEINRRVSQCSLVGLKADAMPIWSQLPVRIAVDESVPEGVYPAIQKAADAWAEVIGREAFVIYRASGKKGFLSRESRIYWNKDRQPASANEQAITHSRWVSGEIIQADITVHQISFKFSTSENVSAEFVDLESLMIHEFGHSLGLGHFGGGVMNPTLQNGLARRTIDAAAKEGIRCLYASSLREKGGRGLASVQSASEGKLVP
jgi:hypothetical protein